MLESLRDIPIVGDVRGAGFFQAIELVKDQRHEGELQRRGVRGAAARLPLGRALPARADLPRRRPRRPRHPALPAADLRHRAVRGDRERAAPGPRQRPRSGSHGGEGTARCSTVEQHGRRARSSSSRPGRAKRPTARSAGSTSPSSRTRRRGSRGGELLLTTGIQLDTAAASGASSSCSPSHGLAGLGLGTGFDHDRLPKALVDEAEKHDFPLFEVPYEMPFIAITERAFTQLVNEQYAVLERGIVAARAARATGARGPRPGARSSARSAHAVGGSGAGRRRRRCGRGRARGRRRSAPQAAVERSAPRSRAARRTADRDHSCPRGPRARRAGARRPGARAGTGGPRAWLVVIRESGRAGRLRAPRGAHRRRSSWRSS